MPKSAFSVDQIYCQKSSMDDGNSLCSGAMEKAIFDRRAGDTPTTAAFFSLTQ